MAVGSSFDRWQKDVFFSAAEEVQESADILESMYRMWIRDRNNGISSEVSDGMRRELHTALGTAKWQLEEFERAVELSHEKYSSEENTITRHKQFVAAIRDQISRIGKDMNDSLTEEGREPLLWVQLDEEERDDLEVFLSAMPQTLQKAKDDADCKRGSSQLKATTESIVGYNNIVSSSEDVRHVVEVTSREASKSEDDELCVQVVDQLNGPRRNLSSSDSGAWKIVIADEEDVDRKSIEMRSEVSTHASNLPGFLRSAEFITRLRWFRNSFWKAKTEEHLQLRHGLLNYLDSKGATRFGQRFNGLAERSRNCFSSCKDSAELSNGQQLSSRVNVLQQQIQRAQYHMQFGRSLRLTFLLALSIILVGSVLNVHIFIS
ncbi:uncharacterized protein [Typha angustifolia]|uniref:uncharacterized protein isoform X1 n=1 Tax=Typha angustifolia TaxID=59011 RepID=UPI003C2EBABF